MSASPPPGWYPDVANPAVQRWWDGGEWSHVTRPAPAPTPPAQRWEPPAGYPAGRVAATPDGVALAGYGQRALARLIDGVITTSATVVIGLPFVRGLMRAMSDYVQSVKDAVNAGTTPPGAFELFDNPVFSSATTGLFVVSLIVGGLYEVGMIGSRGATLGKAAAGVRIRPWVAEGRPTWGQAAKRWLSGQAISALVGAYRLVDWIWPAWDPRHQALHDKWPATVVVRSR